MLSANCLWLSSGCLRRWLLRWLLSYCWMRLVMLSNYSLMFNGTERSCVTTCGAGTFAGAGWVGMTGSVITRQSSSSVLIYKLWSDWAGETSRRPSCRDVVWSLSGMRENLDQRRGLVNTTSVYSTTQKVCSQCPKVISGSFHNMNS